MLSDSERASFRDIKKGLAEKPHREKSFHVGRTARGPTPRHLTYGEFAAWGVLLAAALVIVGAYGAAVLVTAVAVVLGLASYLANPARK